MCSQAIKYENERKYKRKKKNKAITLVNCKLRWIYTGVNVLNPSFLATALREQENRILLITE